MISEGNHVFSMLHATADGMDADFGHFFKVENEKIAEWHVFDDSQKRELDASQAIRTAGQSVVECLC